MEIRNCRRCGKIFYFGRENLCPDCMKLEEQDFEKVRSFLKEFPGSKITDVITYTGVSDKKILRYLREGRIEILDQNQDFLKCLHCGKAISTGRYCKECYSKYSNTVKELYTTSDEQEVVPPKMRFINRSK